MAVYKTGRFIAKDTGLLFTSPYIVLAIGTENTVAIADLTAQLHDYNLGMMGAATSVYAKRLEGFASAVQHYFPKRKS